MYQYIVPFRQFVLKIASRCDLSCDHCYVYEHADQGWRGQPMVMSDETVTRVADRIAEHATEHRLNTVLVVMHGGEPLLAGLSRLERISRELHRALAGVSQLDLRIHTNGVLLTEKLCEMFRAENIKVGVSLDGDKGANDRHRRYADGRSSYEEATRAVTLLRDRHPEIYAGLLCTVDIRNDPVAVYEALLALAPPRIDFLLPHGTWDQPPPRPDGDETAYADWLITIHDRWVSAGKPVAIRLFDSITRAADGRGSRTESLGLASSDLVVIETDGSYEQADSLKIAYDGAPATDLDVFHHSLDEVALHPGMTARQGDVTTLAGECQRCPLVVSCGGGLYAHRYRTGSGFENPSVYCADLLRLIPHVQRATGRVNHALPASTLDLLAGASGGPAEITRLLAPQLSLTRLMVSTANRAAGGSSSWALLTRLDREHRDAVDRIFEHPYVRTWAARWAGQTRVPPGPTDFGHLAAIVAAVALRVGEPAKVTVPVRGGMVYLPSIGRMRVGGGEVAHIEIGAGSFAVGVDGRWRDEGSADWEPVRSLGAGGIQVLVDDVDPYRDCYGTPVRDRLSQSEFGDWQKVLALAWRLLLREHPDQAAAMGAGLRVITPLAGEGERVSSARQAYGALALAESSDPETLAMLMVGEFRYAQLGAVLDMFDLAGGDARVEVSLRDAYVGLAVVDFLGADDAGSMLRQVRATTRRLSAGSLPDIGRRFVAGMSAAAAARLSGLEPRGTARAH